MATKGGGLAGGAEVPEADGGVEGGGGDHVRVRRDGARRDAARVAAELLHALEGGEVPQLPPPRGRACGVNRRAAEPRALEGRGVAWRGPYGGRQSMSVTRGA